MNHTAGKEIGLYQFRQQFSRSCERPAASTTSRRAAKLSGTCSKGGRACRFQAWKKETNTLIVRGLKHKKTLATTTSVSNILLLSRRADLLKLKRWQTLTNTRRTREGGGENTYVAIHSEGLNRKHGTEVSSRISPPLRRNKLGAEVPGKKESISQKRPARSRD